jgi:hypothetical protein
MKSQRQKAIVVFFLTFGVLASAYAKMWQRFDSSTHFSVAYPGTWFRIGVSTDRLQLLSSKGGAEGFVIKRGQAEISVMEEKGTPTETLDEAIVYYTQGTSVLSRKKLRIESGSHGCNDLVEVTSKEEAIPPEDIPTTVPFIINTEMFCVVGGHMIVIILRNWEDDNRQEDYQQVALRMTKTIRMNN